VKHGVHRYRRFCTLEKDGVWKPPHQSPAVRLVNHGIDQRLAADALDTRIERTEELPAQPQPVSFIPDIRFGDIELGIRREN
jgi:hypothetical protein